MFDDNGLGVELLECASSDEDNLFKSFLVEFERVGRENGADYRLLLARTMIRAAGADIRASVDPITAWQVLRDEATDHWCVMSAAKRRAA